VITVSVRLERDGLSEGLLLAGLATAGLLYLNLMPALIHALTEGLHVSRQTAGLIASVNAYGTAIGNLAGVFVVNRVPPRRCAAWLLIALLVFDTASIFANNQGLLGPIRCAHGLCGGVLIALGFALIGRTRNPDRNFGLLIVLQCALAGGGVMLLPRLVADHGAIPFFGALICVDALMLALLPLLDVRASQSHQSRTVSPDSKSSVSVALIATLFGISLFQMAKLMVGAHIIDLGRSKGLSLEEVTSTVGMADWFAIVGAFVVVVMSSRIGRATPIALGVAASIGCAVTYRYSSHLETFRAACVLSAIVGATVISYLFATAACIGSTGRDAALAGFASKVGLGTAPMLGAFIVTQEGYAALLNAMMILLLVSAACVLPGALALDKRERHSAVCKRRADRAGRSPR
jgi:predicted MFS family arabinose efflux permease